MQVENNKRGSMKETNITAREAVFGFAAWLTCRTNPVTFSSTHEASIAAHLANEWCEKNNLPKIREDIYPNNIVQPKE